MKLKFILISCCILFINDPVLVSHQAIMGRWSHEFSSDNPLTSKHCNFELTGKFTCEVSTADGTGPTIYLHIHIDAGTWALIQNTLTLTFDHDNAPASNADEQSYTIVNATAGHLTLLNQAKIKEHWVRVADGA